jgi:hypothetical protein
MEDEVFRGAILIIEDVCCSIDDMKFFDVRRLSLGGNVARKIGIKFAFAPHLTTAQF